MKKKLLLSLVLAFVLLNRSQPVMAQVNLPNCSSMGINTIEGVGGVYTVDEPHRVVLDFSNALTLDLNGRYQVLAESSQRSAAQIAPGFGSSSMTPLNENHILDVIYEERLTWLENNERTVYLYLKSDRQEAFCYIGSYTFSVVGEPGCADITISQTREVGGQLTECYLGSCFDRESEINVSCQFTMNGQPSSVPENYSVNIGEIGSLTFNPLHSSNYAETDDGFLSFSWRPYSVVGVRESVNIGIEYSGPDFIETMIFESGPLPLEAACNEGTTCIQQENSFSSSGGLRTEAFALCNQINKASENYADCLQCVGDGTDVQKIWTAIGCIPTDIESIIGVVLKMGLLLGGGATLLMILAGAFSISVSQGDPKKTGEAKDLITAAIIGLIFIIFSISILQYIGVNILHIPGFAN
ncbi:MAG: hypothetical protein GF381_04765 [Candidatus Pacebacteria bacterium]|nr:hypothetical protein [Candidatus Paceibacterota bacterium]